MRWGTISLVTMSAVFYLMQWEEFWTRKLRTGIGAAPAGPQSKCEASAMGGGRRSVHDSTQQKRVGMSFETLSASLCPAAKDALLSPAKHLACGDRLSLSC